MISPTFFGLITPFWFLLSIVFPSGVSVNVIDYGAVGNGLIDDSQAFAKAWRASCLATQADQAKIVIPAAKTFLLQPTYFNGPCNSNSVHVEVLGTIVAPSTPNAWSKCVQHWLSFSGVTNLIVSGNGAFDGKGALWWRGCKHQCHQPQALHFVNCNNLQLRGLAHVDSPKGHISINHCNNVTISNLHIRAPEDSPNTDGIDISVSRHVDIRDSIIATGDDCIAVINGSSFINITNVACGPGHGISVGSLGKDGTYATAEEIHVKNCTFNRTQNGARIKTWQGGSGYARHISFQEITLIGGNHPIIIDQSYCPGKLKCKRNLTEAVLVSDVSYIGFHGTSEKEAVSLSCAAEGCMNIVMRDVNITPVHPGTKLRATCTNANGTFRDTQPAPACLKNVTKAE